MGDAFIVRRGGSGGLSKCTIVVNAETGSTVAAYSNSGATTKVKDAEEVGTSGSYVISGLNTGTYYVKATKGSKSKISSAITFNVYAVKEVTLLYEFVLLSETSGLASGYNVSGTAIIPAIDVTPYSTMTISAKRTYAAASGYFTVCGLIKYGEEEPSGYISVNQNTKKTYTLDIRALIGNYYFITEGDITKSGKILISNLNDAVISEIYSIVFS